MKRETQSADEEALAVQQEKFIGAVEGIGDILVFDIKRKNQNKAVLQNLKNLTDLVKELFALRDRSPDKFQHMVLARPLFKLFHENPEAAKFRMAFAPEESLIAFSSALNQIRRLHSAAIEVRNEEVSRRATYHLNWLLADLAQSPNNGAFIELVLQNLQGAMREAVKADDSSAYSAAVSWYVDIVFKGSLQKDGAFHLDYLPIFDRFFIYVARFIISGDHKKLFAALMSALIDGIMPSLDAGKIWDYGHIIMESNVELYRQLEPKYGIERRLQELAASESTIDTREKLDSWLARFKEMKGLLIPHFSPADAEKAAGIEAEVAEHVTDAYKHNDLVELMFKIGAFCLAEGKPQYIRSLWEYKQPPDSEAHWIGHDVVPGTLKEILDIYLRPAMREPEFSLLDGHRSIVPYLRKYFLLVVSRTLQGETPPPAYDFRNWEAPQLSDLASMMRGLIPVAKSISDAPELAAALGFKQADVPKIFGTRLVELLSELADGAEEQIADIERDRPMAASKIAEFRSVVSKEYKRVASLRSLYSYYGLIVDHEKAVGKRWGIKTVDAKAGFFEQWYVNYVGWGTNYGQRMAIGEDSLLGSKLAERCIRIEPRNLDEAIRNSGDQPLILASRRAALSFRLGSRFDPAWRMKDEEKPQTARFEGWYVVDDRRVPIFEFHSEKAGNLVLILARESLGKLHQFSPLDPGETEDVRVENLMIRARAFSQDEALMNETLANPPDWVAKIVGDEEKRSHLKMRVLIDVSERFRLCLPRKFVGWSYDVTAQDL